MLRFEDIYHITNGIYLSHQKKSQKPILYVKHSQEKMNKTKHLYPTSHFKDWDRLEFILYCNFVMYTTRASSIFTLIENLVNKEFYKKFLVFLEVLKTYKVFLKKDCLYLKELYNDPSIEECIEEFTKKNIKFTTMFILWNKKFRKERSSKIISNIHLDKLFNLFKFIKLEDLDNIKPENFEFYERMF